MGTMNADGYKSIHVAANPVRGKSRHARRVLALRSTIDLRTKRVFACRVLGRGVVETLPSLIAHEDRLHGTTGLASVSSAYVNTGHLRRAA